MTTAAFCPSCGTRSGPDDRFCGSCGGSLELDGAPPPRVEAHAAEPAASEPAAVEPDLRWLGGMGVAASVLVLAGYVLPWVHLDAIDVSGTRNGVDEGPVVIPLLALTTGLPSVLVALGRRRALSGAYADHPRQLRGLYLFQAVVVAIVSVVDATDVLDRIGEARELTGDDDVAVLGIGLPFVLGGAAVMALTGVLELTAARTGAPWRPRSLVVALVAGLLVGGTLVGLAAGDDADARAEELLRELQALADEPFTPDVEVMTGWQRRLNAVLSEVDSDPDLFAEVQALVVGKSAEDAMAMRLASSTATALTGDEDTSELLAETERSRGSRLLEWIRREVQRKLDDAGSGLLEKLRNLASTQMATEALAEDPRGVAQGTNPVVQAYQRDDFEAVSRIAYPRLATDCPPGHLYAQGRCEPDLSGHWRGRWQGEVSTIAPDQSSLLSCDVGGPLTAQLTQTGAVVAGTFYAGGALVNFETCGQIQDLTATIADGRVEGLRVSGRLDDSASFALVRKSNHWLMGKIDSRLGTLSVDLAREAPVP